jgi:hypothetical protein
MPSWLCLIVPCGAAAKEVYITRMAVLDEIRASARLALSNAEAVVERMLAEPRSRHTMPPCTPVGIVGASRRNSLAALSLHAGLKRGVRSQASGIRDLASELASSLLILANAVREGSAPALPRLQQSQLVRASNDVIKDEIDLIAESLDMLAELLAKDAATVELNTSNGVHGRTSVAALRIV